jgi:hypothetical protein
MALSEWLMTEILSTVYPSNDTFAKARAMPIESHAAEKLYG